MAKKKNKKKLVFLWIFLAVVLVAGIVAIWVLSDGGNTSPRSFIVKCDNKIVTPNYVSSCRLDNEVRFDVMYFSDVLDNKNTDYSVKIVPVVSSKTDTYFYVDSVKTSFLTLKDEDFSKYFGLEKSDGFFTVKLPVDFSYENAVRFYYSDETAVDFNGDFNYDIPYFKIVVTSEDGKSVYEIPISVIYPVSFVSLDDNGYIFK